jgi:hypothetical protein
LWLGNSSESAAFTTKNSANNQLKLSLPGGKSFNLTVNYNCQGALTTTVNKTSADKTVTFFKVVEIVKNDNGAYTTQGLAEPLNKYDLSDVLAQRAKTD